MFELQSYNMNITDIIAALISEDVDQVGEFFAAIACVQDNQGRWLLGRSTATDDRRGKWCFPGGGIDDGETPERAAVRECWEEAGIRCRPVGAAFTVKNKPGVAFVYCQTSREQAIDHNSEFDAMDFFTLGDLAKLELHTNVRELIRRC